jgi:peptidoglycan LD-endopeptidase LytH
VKKIIILTILLILLIYVVLRAVSFMISPRNSNFLLWLRGDSADRESLVTVQRDKCEGAPFILPADGYIGLLYGDPRGPYSASNPHQGIDIFSDAEPGVIPVYAAYDGYLTREPDWRSAVILRVPDDPLNPGVQVWLFYTHMADREGNSFIVDSFPPGTSEMFVQQGTLLGYTGDYNGNSPRTIWVHLHFSIVKDDGSGQYLNELHFENTLDPSPYLGLPVNYACTEIDTSPIQCSPNPTCS